VAAGACIRDGRLTLSIIGASANGAASSFHSIPGRYRYLPKIETFSAEEIELRRRTSRVLSTAGRW
jgi:hypothetical protein